MGRPVRRIQCDGGLVSQACVLNHTFVQTTCNVKNHTRSPAASLGVPDLDEPVEGGRRQDHVRQEDAAGYAVAAARQGLHFLLRAWRVYHCAFKALADKSIPK